MCVCAPGQGEFPRDQTLGCLLPPACSQEIRVCVCVCGCGYLFPSEQETLTRIVGFVE